MRDTKELLLENLKKSSSSHSSEGTDKHCVKKGVWGVRKTAATHPRSTSTLVSSKSGNTILSRQENVKVPKQVVCQVSR